MAAEGRPSPGDAGLLDTSGDEHFLFSPAGFQSPFVTGLDPSPLHYARDGRDETQAAETLAELAREPGSGQSAPAKKKRKTKKELKDWSSSASSAPPPPPALPRSALSSQPSSSTSSAKPVAHAANLPGYQLVSMSPAFGEIYYRNDRKSVQCFPVCPTHGTYEQAIKAMNASRGAPADISRLAPADAARAGWHSKHNESGSCRSGINVSLALPDLLDDKRVQPFLRFVRTVEAEASPPPESEVPFQIGKSHSARELTDWGLYRGEWSAAKNVWNFAPRSWKLLGELNRANRNLNDKKTFAMQVIVTLRLSDVEDTVNASYSIVAKFLTSSFDVLNCKTLMRDVKKVESESNRLSSSSSPPSLPPALPAFTPAAVMFPKSSSSSSSSSSTTTTTTVISPLDFDKPVKTFMPPPKTTKSSATTASSVPPMTPLTSFAAFLSPSLIPPTPSSALMLSVTPPAVTLPPDAFDEPTGSANN